MAAALLPAGKCFALPRLKISYSAVLNSLNLGKLKCLQIIIAHFLGHDVTASSQTYKNCLYLALLSEVEELLSSNPLFNSE